MRSDLTVAPPSGFTYPVGSTARGQLPGGLAAAPEPGLVECARCEMNAAREASARAVGVEAWGPALARLLATIAASSAMPATLLGPRLGRRERAATARSPHTWKVANRSRHAVLRARRSAARGGGSGAGSGRPRLILSRRARERSSD